MCIHLAPDGYLYEFHKQPLLAANIKRNTILKTKDKNKKSKQTKEQKQLLKPKQNLMHMVAVCPKGKKRKSEL